MKLWTLAENTACREDFTCEHGLSLYIEAGGQRILFDAGQSGAFADNARKLGVDLTKVDLAVLSHGHYDHGGGLMRFFEINSHAPVYMSPHAFGAHYNAQGKYIGLDQALSRSDRIRFNQETQVLGEGITLFSCSGASMPYPVEPFGLTVLENGRKIPEDFRHEQYLLIEEAGKRILISGCSHRGILNIVHWFHPDVLIGGFHFMKMDPGSRELEAAAKRLMDYGTLYYTGHCTGQDQFDRMKQIMGDKLSYLSTGTILTI